MRAASAPILAVILGVGAAWAGASGCAAVPRGTPIGMSDAVPEGGRLPEALAPSASPPAFAVGRSWPEAGPATHAVGHRRDGSLVHVRAAPTALSAYVELAGDAQMPDGAQVVAWHEEPDGRVLGGSLLQKSGGVWTAVELDARGGVLTGDQSRCLRCHDMAPTDHLFGLPLPAAQAPSARELIDAEPR